MLRRKLKGRRRTSCPAEIEGREWSRCRNCLSWAGNSSPLGVPWCGERKLNIQHGHTLPDLFGVGGRPSGRIVIEDHAHAKRHLPQSMGHWKKRKNIIRWGRLYTQVGRARVPFARLSLIYSCREKFSFFFPYRPCSINQANLNSADSWGAWGLDVTLSQERLAGNLIMRTLVAVTIMKQATFSISKSWRFHFSPIFAIASN